MANVRFGCNPGAKRIGNIVEDDRGWGCAEGGIGYLRSGLLGGEPVEVPTHIPMACAETHPYGLTENKSWAKEEH